MTEPTPPSITDDEEIIEGGPWIEDSPATAARALFLGILLLMAGNGLQGSLIGVRSASEGFSVTVAGFVMAAYFGGFLAGSRTAETLIAQVGHIRVFAGLASMASAAVLVHALFIDPVTWGLMRFVTGLCMAGLFVTEESWLNDLATNKTRGRLLSIYMMITMGGMTIGQFLLDVADPGGVKLFLLSSLLVSASLIPIVLSASSNPPLSVPERMSLRELAAIIPTGIFCSFWNGAAVGVLIGLGAVYAVAVDVPDSRLAVFLAAPLFGSMLLQWPIGYVSDRVSRRGVILAVAAVAFVTCFVLAGAPEGSWTSIGLMAVLGAVAFPIYSLTIAYTADWLPTEKLTSGSAVLVRVNGVGALVGPLVATVVIGATSPVAYFWTMAATFAVVVVYLAYRIVVAEAPETRRAFVAFPARASATAVALMRGQRKRIDEAERSG